MSGYCQASNLTSHIRTRILAVDLLQAPEIMRQSKRLVCRSFVIEQRQSHALNRQEARHDVGALGQTVGWKKVG